MHSLHRGQSLVVAIALSLTLLVVGVVGIGVAIQHGYVVPPDLDVSLSGVHIVAYVTAPIKCGSYLPCPNPPRKYFVVWALHKIAPDYLNEDGDRILMMPLQP